MSKEIKATDIMIGNWFLGYDEKYFQWEAYHFGAIGNNVTTIEIDEIIKSPIPLTEDKLLKAGFKKETNIYKHESLPCYYIEYLFNVFALRYRFYHKDKNSYLIKQLPFIHTLQNIFKVLTGNNLIIEP